MSDTTRAGEPSKQGHETEQWQQTESLLALRELMTVGAEVGPVIARRAQLSHSELKALELLIKNPMGPVELSKALGVTSAASSGIVDRLASHGHAERVADQRDRRRTHVFITESGRHEVLGHLMPMFVALARLDSSLSDEERDAVTRYLHGAVAAIKSLM